MAGCRPRPINTPSFRVVWTEVKQQPSVLRLTWSLISLWGGGGGGLHGPFLTTPSLCLTCVGWHHVNTFKAALFLRGCKHKHRSGDPIETVSPLPRVTAARRSLTGSARCCSSLRAVRRNAREHSSLLRHLAASRRKHKSPESK